MPSPVNRRAYLPGASELFGGAKAQPAETQPRVPQTQNNAAANASGRVKHDHKITVYFSADELFALESATLELRRRAGRPLDRGRVVRQAVALALSDLEEHGDDSAIAQALTNE